MAGKDWLPEMPVDDIFWDVGIGADYHLVPGLVSPRLDQLLSIIFDGNLMRADAPRRAWPSPS